MPLFFNKFSPSKPTARKKKLLFHSNVIQGPEDRETLEDSVTINLSGQKFIFTNGKWIEDSSLKDLQEKVEAEEVSPSKDCCECLKEENDYLRNKCESLLNLITKLTFNSKNQEKEINRLRRDILLLREGIH